MLSLLLCGLLKDIFISLFQSVPHMRLLWVSEFKSSILVLGLLGGDFTFAKRWR